MTSDLRALLAAIVADPSDDVARLVYADCLEEHGNAARAAFVRLQIEAEQHHPHSNARAALEQKAFSLFAEHWIDWWGEVCAATGLPMPAREPSGRWGRFAQRTGLRGTTGYPYELGSPVFGCAVRTPIGIEPPPSGLAVAGWGRAPFRRGFPDTLFVALDATSAANRTFLSRWTSVSPLATLSADVRSVALWPDGPYLVGVRSLTVCSAEPDVLLPVLRSPELVRLEDLVFVFQAEEYLGPVDVFADVFARAVDLPRTRQLKRLEVPVWDDRTAEVLAGAETLRGLESLEVSLRHEYLAGGGPLAPLAGSPHLAGLRELTIVGANGADLEAAIWNPTWERLRKLDVRLHNHTLDALADADDLPELDELRLSGISYSVAELAALRRSPLLKRLRHFAIYDTRSEADFDIADAVDADRIETFAISTRRTPPRVISMLRERFGHRLRLLD